MYFRICPVCGCYLDPGEKCECETKQEAHEPEEDFSQRMAKRDAQLEQLRAKLSQANAQREQQAAAARKLKLEALRSDLARTITTTAKSA